METLVVSESPITFEVIARLRQGDQAQIPAALREKMKYFKSAVQSLMPGWEIRQRVDGGNLIIRAVRLK